MTTDKPQIVYAAPFVALADDLRRRSAELRVDKADAHAAILEVVVERLTDAIKQASECEYVDTRAAAEFLKIGDEAVRARCRRTLQRQGLAHKRGGTGPWEIHTSALNAA